MEFQMDTNAQGEVVLVSVTYDKEDELQNVVVPEGVNRIHDHAFCDCMKLRDADLPEEWRALILRSIDAPDWVY